MNSAPELSLPVFGAVPGEVAERSSWDVALCAKLDVLAPQPFELRARRLLVARLLARQPTIKLRVESRPATLNVTATQV
jgi:hypothetical protein